LQDQGRIGRIGVSVQSPDELKRVLETPRVAHVQLPCNILDPRWQPLRAQIEQRRADAGLVVHVRSLYLQGLLLSGTDDDWHRAGVGDPASVRGWLARMVTDCGRASTADLCLAWAQAQSWIDGIVVGADNMAQLDQNLVLFSKPPLTRRQLTLIEESRPVIAPTTLDPARWAPREL
jgi:aryl-alcohol dehydrogenase-like predicted oxidoreductase